MLGEEFAGAGTLAQWGVLVDPVNGVAYDYRVTENCGVFTFWYGLATQLVGMPDDMFCAGVDRLDGVTFVTKGKVINP